MKHTSEAEARDAWWRVWREIDYTWDGLKRKRLHGWSRRANGRLIRTEKAPANAKPATLQDLWRSEEDSLVTDADGQTWTVIHAPAFSRTGAPFKGQWTATERNRIDAAIAGAIGRFPSDAFDPPSVPSGKRPLRLGSLGSEWGLLLDGAVLNRLPPLLLAHPVIRGSRIAFIGDTQFNGECPSMNLRRPLFEKTASFLQVQADDFRLSQAVMLRDFTVFESGPHRFSIMNGQIYGEIRLTMIKSEMELLLSRTHCHGDLRIVDASLQRLSLRGVVIDGDFTADKLEVQSLALSKGFIGGQLKIDDMTARNVIMNGLEVSGSATFSDVHIQSKLTGNSAVFHRAVKFVEFRASKLDLSDTAFCDRAEFRGAQIEAGANFARAHFVKAAYFSGADFGTDKDGLLDAFQETRFESFVDFRGVGILDFAAFDGANFKSDVRFDNAVFVKDAGIKAAIAKATNADRLTSLEHGLRALKQAAEAVRDRNGEQTFYRYELMVRRRRAGIGSDERLLSQLYSLTSRYGSSFTRPVLAAVAIWVVFAIAYLTVGALSQAQALQNWAWQGGPPHPAIPEALNLSARSMFNFFGVWSVRPPDSRASVSRLSCCTARRGAAWRRDAFHLASRSFQASFCS